MSVVSLQFGNKSFADVFYLVFFDDLGQVEGLVLGLVFGRSCRLFVGRFIAALIGLVWVGV